MKLKRVICLLIAVLFVFACGCSEHTDTSSSEAESSAVTSEQASESSEEPSDETSEESSASPVIAEPVKIAYIPIDDRPVNYERVQFLAEATNIELLMPERDLFRTALDNMTPNSNGTTYGDREKLLEWVKSVDAECDYFIISLDQMLSGGLVSSRWLDNVDLSFEYGVADEIIELCKNNTVILFDTVMRLASTLNYQGYDYDKYVTLREYGKKARKTLTGKDLTVDKIIAGYKYDTSGNKIAVDLTEEEVDKYLASRTRKLKLADYILKSVKDTMNFIYYGVDDSNPQVTIQTNEIDYINTLIGKKGVLSAACDELGMCCLTRMLTLIHGETETELTYYGPGRDLPADEFDIGTLSSTVEAHLLSMNTKIVKSSKVLQTLILTRGCTENDRNALVTQLKNNLEKKIPTVIIDVSYEQLKLGEILLSDGSIGIAKILGYSSWNTTGNALGLALSMGIGRNIYLNSVEKSSEEANEGFLKTITFAFIKDLSYRASHTTIDGFLTGNYTCAAKDFVNKINQSDILVSTTEYEPHGKVRISSPRYPWNRTFEMIFNIGISK